MDRFFESFRGDAESAAGVFPAINVTHKDDCYHLRAELPGVNPKELNISVERNTVSLSGKREIQGEGEGASYHRRERSGGSFSRSFTLPDELNAEAVEAAYTNGVLTVTLPKAEAAKARQIAVKAK
jgi:HSP20 family protein